MSYEINVKETADNDLVNAVKYYESEQAGLGERFFKLLGTNIRTIKTSTTKLSEATQKL
jgi:hypothetical protein